MIIPIRILLLDDEAANARFEVWRSLRRLATGELNKDAEVWRLDTLTDSTVEVSCDVIGQVEPAREALLGGAKGYDLVLLDNDWKQVYAGHDTGLKLLKEAFDQGVRFNLLAIYTASVKFEPQMIMAALRGGARGIVNKQDYNHLHNLLFFGVQMAKELADAKAANEKLQGTFQTALAEADKRLVTRSPAMQKCLVEAAQFALQPNVPVILHGDTGTGKAVLAKAMHNASPRAARPFILLDCARHAGVDKALLNDLLFGHVKGAYSGADSARAGVFEQADGGTVFIDELQLMPRDHQNSLLNVLTEKVVQRVGGNADIRCDFRVICATSEPPEVLIAAGRLNSHLLERLNLGRVNLPALNERPEDIEDKANEFLTRFATAHRKSVVGLTPAALQRLTAFDWERNVRQLENTIERSVLLAPADRRELDAADLRMDADGMPELPRKPLNIGTVMKLRPRNNSDQQAVYDLLVERYPQAVPYIELHAKVDPKVSDHASASGNLVTVVSRLNTRLNPHGLDVENERGAYRLVLTATP